MRNFVKLLSFEINRFLKLYIALLILIGVAQIGLFLISAFTYKSRLNSSIRIDNISPQTFIQNYGYFSAADVSAYSFWFYITIFVGIVSMMFYVFFIWYRDWFAKNAFIYRLLTLPTNRMNVYFAKLTTIMLAVWGLIAYQLFLLLLGSQVVKLIIPKIYRIDSSVNETVSQSYYLNYLLPETVMEFVINYGAGLIFVVCIFTIILFERSYKYIGIVYGLLYNAAMSLLFFAPILISVAITGDIYVYPSESLIIQMIMALLILACSLVISASLINKKVTV